MKPAASRVIGVVVTYHPDLELLHALIAAAAPQVSQIVIVDNTPAAQAPDLTGLPDCVHVVRLGRNPGLAAGLNTGCRWALAHGAQHVLLFDQDSLPAEDMVKRQAQAWAAAEARGLRVAAAGPRFGDPRGSHVFAFVRLGWLRNSEVAVRPEDEFVRTQTLITSGSLIAADALEDAGPMDESLFIDNVDLEWGFRAQARGWALVGAPRALLHHRIGDSHVRAPAWARALGKKHVIQHVPTRLYYIMRNRIRLYWMRHVPLPWKSQDVLRLPVKLVLSLWLASDRRSMAIALVRGIVDGVANRGGVMPRGAPDQEP